jgi:hypothetical protein
LALSVGQCRDPVYDGPAHAERDGQIRSVVCRLKGEAPVWCVRAGMRPEQVEKVFGPPLLIDQFRGSPVAWWYADLGAMVYFPPRFFKPAGPVNRVLGGIGD